MLDWYNQEYAEARKANDEDRIEELNDYKDKWNEDFSEYETIKTSAEDNEDAADEARDD